MSESGDAAVTEVVKIDCKRQMLNSLPVEVRVCVCK